jgi:SAM-dependent methyltransferase
VSASVPPLPLPDPAVVDNIGADLRAAGFDAAGVPALLGRSAHDALGRGEYWPALHRTRQLSPLATLIRLFLLGSTEPEEAARTALPRTGVRAAIDAGVLQRHRDGLRAQLDIRPHADDDAEFLVISDPDSDTRPGPVHRDHVLGIGAASVSLARAVIRRPVRSALDLGTGCGIQALHLNSHAEQVVATDTNPRALALAAATARINGMSWDLRAGSLFEPVAGQQFDLIVSNPPFVIGSGERRYIYRDSGMVGDALCERIVREVPAFLRPGGVAQLLANWLVFDSDDWRLRVGEWVTDTGCDGWVVQREFADPAQYVSVWLSDAGEDREVAAQQGAEWLDWFVDRRVRGIGMGVITLRRKESGDDSAADLVLDEITGAGEEVTGPEADAFLARRRYLQNASDEMLLTERLSLDPGVLLAERSLAGHGGWTTVLRMLTRSGGPGATLQLDEWSRALLAGCRGEVPLGLLIELLAVANGLDETALIAAVLPSVRVAIGRGLLHLTAADGDPRLVDEVNGADQ